MHVTADRSPGLAELAPAAAGAEAARLPATLTSFVGRERELEAVRGILAIARLLTLTGAGGSGKTRLAREVAGAVAGSFPDGVAWVELAPLAEPELVASHVASAIGLRQEGGGDAQAMLIDALRRRAMLLVLDNCEHLVDAVAALAETLLRECPELRVLATSREALGVAGERAWLVPALALPPAGDAGPETIARAEAVRLFVARARDVASGFALTPANARAVAQLCRRLDGLPLAIELAAARARVLTAEQIAQRLDTSFEVLASRVRGVPTRHQTLRAAIDWSYRLLGGAEQALLQRLAAFTGGFTLDAVEAVCAGDGIAAADILDLVASLVDKSLVVMREEAGSARYVLLETVRQFAAERLRESGQERLVRARHAAYFVALAERGEPYVFCGGEGSDWLARLEAEHGNLGAAADWLDADPDGAEGALRLAGALDWFWYGTGRFAEGRRRIARALAHGGSAPPRERARALVAAGSQAFWQMDLAAMRAPLDEAIAILRPLDDARTLGMALASRGASLVFTGEVEEGRRVLAEAVRVAEARHPEVAALAISVTGHAAVLSGDLDVAEARLARSLAILDGLGFTSVTADIDVGLGRVWIARGEMARARACMAESLRKHRRLGTRPWGAVHALEGIAAIESQGGDDVRAAVLHGAADALRERTGMLLRPYVAYPAMLGEVEARLGAEAFAAAVARGRAMGSDAATAFAIEGAAPAVEPATVPAAATPAAVVASPAPAAAPPARLRVRALGALQVTLDGEPLASGAWQYAKPRELLLYLLCHPEGRTREQLGLVFWPDATTAQVKNNFHVTLHHLRKALGGGEWIRYEGDRYAVNDALGVAFDAREFERRVRDAQRTGGIDALRDALGLYGGEFLEDVAVGDWHLEPRDRLRRLFVDGTLALGERLAAAGRDAEAAAQYAALVARDPLHEEACRRLMVALARAGERGEALRHYQRLAALLAADLDAAPEPATTALADRIRRGEPVPPAP